MKYRHGTWVLASCAFFLNLTASAAASTIPNHVLTWGYTGSYGGVTDGSTLDVTNSTSRAWVQQWITYAESLGSRGQKNRGECSPYVANAPCTVVAYFDPNKHFDASSVDRDFFADMNALGLPDDGALYHAQTPLSPSNRITSQRGACARPPYCSLPNTSNASVYGWYNTKLIQQGLDNRYGRSGGWLEGTIMYEDDAEAYCANLVYRYRPKNVVELGGPPSSTCDTNLQSNVNTFNTHLHWSDGKPISLFLNSALAGVNATPNKPSYLANMLSPSNVLGGTCEGCLSSYVDSAVKPKFVGHYLDTVSDVIIGNNKIFVMYSQTSAADGTTNACDENGANCGQLAVRLFNLAFDWLAYDLTKYVYFDHYKPARSRLDAWPEEQLVPTEPIKTMSPYASTSGNGSGCKPGGSRDSGQAGGAVGLVVACGATADGIPAGVYVREFRTCYNYGASVGACAAILNATSSSITVAETWLSQRYNHVLSLTGETVHDSCTLGAPCGSSIVNIRGGSFKLGSTQVQANSGLILMP